MHKDLLAGEAATSLSKLDIPYVELELIWVSSMFWEPLKVEIPELGEVVVGSGPGGFSWTIFSRGEDCYICGRCCTSYHRRTFFWSEPGDKAPQGLPKVELSINEEPHVWRYYLQQNLAERGKCDFLSKDLLGFTSDQEGCLLHAKGEKNQICITSATTEPRLIRTKRGKHILLSRRLPGRNWRWPRCPIPVYSLPFTKKQMMFDIYRFDRLSAAYGHIPGNFIRDAKALYIMIAERALAGDPPKESIYFEDYQ